MAGIYGGAVLTISAALSSDVDSGLLRPDEIDLKQKIPAPEHPLQQDPLYKRGWALQERILSPRIVIFGSDQMYWECREVQKGINGRQLGGMTGCRLETFRLDKWQREWRSIIREFSNRRLSVESDKLPALSGIAAHYHRSTQDRYLAGLWEEQLIADLEWRHIRMIIGNRVPPSVPSKYRAPSWSWASVDGNITYYRFPNAFRPRTSLVSSNIELKDPSSPFGEVLSGSITLRGPVLPAWCDRETVVLSDGMRGAVWMDERIPTGELGWESGSEWERNDVEMEAEVHCLGLGVGSGDGSGLVLRGVEGREGVFERLGFFHLCEPFFEGVEDVVVTLI